MALYQCPRIEYEVLPVEWTIAAGLYRSTQISFDWLTCLRSCQSIDELIVLGLEYIRLALHFVEEVLQNLRELERQGWRAAQASGTHDALGDRGFGSLQMNRAFCSSSSVE